MNRNRQTRIIATRSSDGYGEASDVLDPRLRGRVTSSTKDEEKSWWCVALSETCVLYLNHYTLRHGLTVGDSIIRHWNLEGSLDGSTWILLREHVRDHKLKGEHPFSATLSIDGEVGALRYFRIVQTGKNSSGGYGLYLSGIELYAVLIKRSDSQ